MMAMAEKFADKEPEVEEEDDTSSFEEVQKPVERTSASRPSSSTATKNEAVAPTSSVWKGPDAAKRDDVSAPVAEVRAGFERVTACRLTRTQGDEPTPLSARAIDHDSGSATPTTPSASLGSSGIEALERKVRNLTAMLAQQTRQMSNMALTLDVLKSEVSALKEKVGD
jgi:coronin-1B/1C/6